MGGSKEMLSETSGKNKAGKWEVGQDAFSETGSYRFGQLVTTVGGGQRTSSRLAIGHPIHPFCSH